MNIDNNTSSIQPAEQIQPESLPSPLPRNRLKEYWANMSPEQRSQIARDRSAKAKANKLAKAKRAEKKEKRKKETFYTNHTEPPSRVVGTNGFYTCRLNSLRSQIKQVLSLSGGIQLVDIQARETLASVHILVWRILSDSIAIQDVFEAGDSSPLKQ
jgi:hypothetical protein